MQEIASPPILPSVTTTYLEMTNPAALRRYKRKSSDGVLTVVQAKIPCYPLNKFFYGTVGKDWRWTDRLVWSDEHWSHYVRQPTLQTWIGYSEGTPAGYFELQAQPQESGLSVEIAYFGLLPQFIGQGLGGQLLTQAIERAWEAGASRVWVHTCTWDGPNALANYKARGLTIYKVEAEPVQATMAILKVSSKQ